MTETPRNDSEDFLFGGGAKSASFLTISDAHVGVIVEEPTRVQACDYKTGDPKFWPAKGGQVQGDPVMQLRVTIQTDERVDADDDGRRAIYVSGARKPESQSKLAATIAAVKAAGAAGLKVGGRFGLQYVADGTKPADGGSPPKMYRAIYEPPETQADAFLADPPFLGQASLPIQVPPPAPAPTAPVQSPWPATQPAQASVAAFPAGPVAQPATVQGVRTREEALRLAAQLKLLGQPDAVILQVYPEVTAQEVANLPTSNEPPF